MIEIEVLAASWNLFRAAFFSSSVVLSSVIAASPSPLPLRAPQPHAGADFTIELGDGSRKVSSALSTINVSPWRF
jgi:hypothetical protein